MEDDVKGLNVHRCPTDAQAVAQCLEYDTILGSSAAGRLHQGRSAPRNGCRRPWWCVGLPCRVTTWVVRSGWGPRGAEAHPGLAYPLGQCQGISPATSEVHTKVAVIEHEGDLAAMERSRAAVKHGGLPGKEVLIGRCAALSRLALRLGGGGSPSSAQRRSRTRGRTASPSGTRAGTHR